MLTRGFNLAKPLSMVDLVAIINEACRQKGISAAAASMKAVGNPSLVRNIKNGNSPSFKNLQRLLEVLDVPLILGKSQGDGTVTLPNVEWQVLIDAIALVEEHLEAYDLTLEVKHKARIICEIYQLLSYGKKGQAKEDLVKYLRLVA